MRHSHPGSLRDQAAFLRRPFLQDGVLPFTDVLTEGVIAHALTAVGNWLDWISSPLVTLWVFLGQILSADPSCRAARPPDRSTRWLLLEPAFRFTILRDTLLIEPPATSCNWGNFSGLNPGNLSRLYLYNC